MVNDKHIVWRWAKPAKRFVPTRNRSWGDLELGVFNYVVFAGLSPTAWIWIGRARPSEGAVLHRISLNGEEASRCVVAEQYFDPSEKEIDEYLMRTGRKRIGSLRGYSREQYPLSFIPLPEYDDEHNIPEVLIPFEVEANVDWIRTYWVRLRVKLNPRLGRFPSKYYK